MVLLKCVVFAINLFFMVTGIVSLGFIAVVAFSFSLLCQRQNAWLAFEDVTIIREKGCGKRTKFLNYRSLRFHVLADTALNY